MVSACDMHRWRAGVRLVPKLKQVAVDQDIHIHPGFELLFRVQSGHNLLCNAVANFTHGRFFCSQSAYAGF